MEKIFENVPELTTAEDYEAVLSHVKNLGDVIDYQNK
jgi:site-specific DNA-cytosine methylase